MVNVHKCKNWKTKFGFHGSDVSRRCCNGPRDGVGGGGGASVGASGGGSSGGGSSGGGGGGKSGGGTMSCSGEIISLIISLLTLY